MRQGIYTLDENNKMTMGETYIEPAYDKMIM